MLLLALFAPALACPTVELEYGNENAYKKSSFKHRWTFVTTVPDTSDQAWTVHYRTATPKAVWARRTVRPGERQVANVYSDSPTDSKVDYYCVPAEIEPGCEGYRSCVTQTARSYLDREKQSVFAFCAEQAHTSNEECPEFTGTVDLQCSTGARSVAMVLRQRPGAVIIEAAGRSVTIPGKTDPDRLNDQLQFLCGDGSDVIVDSKIDALRALLRAVANAERRSCEEAYGKDSAECVATAPTSNGVRD